MTHLNHIPLALAVLAALGLAACGSAGSAADAGRAGSAAGAPQTADAAVAVACQQVSAVLSDGPDPDADPVGYAEAQVNPLRKIRTQDPALRDAIGRLAGAYQEFFTSNGTETAKEAVSVASSAISKICPGATS